MEGSCCTRPAEMRQRVCAHKTFLGSALLALLWARAGLGEGDACRITQNLSASVSIHIVLHHTFHARVHSRRVSSYHASPVHGINAWSWRVGGVAGTSRGVKATLCHLVPWHALHLAPCPLVPSWGVLGPCSVWYWTNSGGCICLAQAMCAVPAPG